MKEIINLKMEGLITKVELVKEILYINIGDRKIEIWGEHSQDCCENVYIDFGNTLPYLKNTINKKVKFFQVLLIENEGFCIFFADSPEMRIAFNCYNKQNGFYSDRLDLKISIDSFVKAIDLENCKINKIY